MGGADIDYTGTNNNIININAYIALICYLISKRPALSKREERELKELEDIIAKTYGFKK